MRNRVILLSLLFLLTAVAMPAEAKRSCDATPEAPGCSNNGNHGDIEEYCAQNPDAKRCVRAVAKEVCNVVVIHSTTAPQLGVWDPLLGIIEFNPEDCYDYYMEVEDTEPRYMFTYDQGEFRYDLKKTLV